VAQSYAKNFGLYGERVGCAHVFTGCEEEAENSLSQLKRIARTLWSNPPLQGARIVARVLGNVDLKNKWLENVKMVSHRIINMREQLREKLEKIDCKPPGACKSWDHITTQIGMFSFTGLSEESCNTMMDKHHVFLLKNGRISMCGLNTKNID